MIWLLLAALGALGFVAASGSNVVTNSDGSKEIAPGSKHAIFQALKGKYLRKESEHVFLLVPSMPGPDAMPAAELAANVAMLHGAAVFVTPDVKRMRFAPLSQGPALGAEGWAIFLRPGTPGLFKKV